MLELLHSGAALTLPLLPHLLSGPGGVPSGATRLPSPAPAAARGAANCPSSPSYSLTEDEDDAAGAAAAAAATEGLVESPWVQAERIAQQFNLNQEQREVLQYVAGWAAISCGGGSSASKRRGSTSGAAAAVAGQPPPICLVHGPFGSGERLSRV